MWSFWKWKSEEQRIRDEFSQHLAKGVIDEILKNPNQGLPSVKPWTSCYVLLQVRDADLQEMTQHLNTAIDIVVRRDGIVCGILSSVMLAAFGLPFVDDNLGRQRAQQAKAIARLAAKLGTNARLIYGTTSGMAGTVGNSEYQLHGFFLPDFDKQLERLRALDFGKAIEV